MGQGRRAVCAPTSPRCSARLEKKGYDVGSADGLPGFKTRRSIGDWQAKNGRAATCFPDQELVSASNRWRVATTAHLNLHHAMVPAPRYAAFDNSRCTSARISNERSRARGRRSARSPSTRRLRSGARMRRCLASPFRASRPLRSDSAWPAWSCAIGSSVSLVAVDRRRQLPGRPVRKLTKACCSEVNSSRASASVSAANTLSAEHRHRACRAVPTAGSASGRCRARARDRPARNARRRHRAGRAWPRVGRHRGWSRGSRPARLALRRARRARAGLAAAGGNSPAVRRHPAGSCRRRLRDCAAAPAPSPCRCPARGRGRDRCGPGYSAASVPNCSAMTSGAWLGSMMPPAPTRIVDGARRDMGDHHGGGRAGDAGHVVVLGQPVPGSPAARHGGQGRASSSDCAASLPSAIGERSRTESGIIDR